MEQYEPIIRLVKKTDELKASDIAILEQYQKEFPYLQAVRALIAKVSANPHHIKNATAYTAHRTVLREFIRLPFDKNINIASTEHIQLQTEMVNAFEKLSDNSNTEAQTVAEETLLPILEVELPPVASEVELPPISKEVVSEEKQETSQTTENKDFPDYQIPSSYQTNVYEDSLSELMKNIEESKKTLDKIREESLQQLETQTAKLRAEPPVAEKPTQSDADNPLDFSFFDITTLNQPDKQND